MMKLKTRLPLVLGILTLLATTAVPSSVSARPFNRTRVMDLKYAWGTTSLTEFDMYDQMYPGYLPIAEITFQPDGSFTAFDTGSGGTGFGVYDKRGRNLEITIISPSYSGVVQYVGKRVSSGVFEGEILVNGMVSGHWWGNF